MNERLQVFDTKMQKSVASLEAELATIRAGRANPNVLNKLTVDYYGIPTPIQQVANISVPEARMIQIQPWEKSLIKEIEKAKRSIHIEVYIFQNDTFGKTLLDLLYKKASQGIKVKVLYDPNGNIFNHHKWLKK